MSSTDNHSDRESSRESSREMFEMKDLGSSSRSDPKLNASSDSLLDKELEAKRKRQAEQMLPWRARLRRMVWREKYFIGFIGGILLLFVIAAFTIWRHFSWAAWYSLLVVVLTFALLIKNWMDPALTMMLSTTLILAASIIDDATAIESFGNTGVFAIAVLFVVAAGIAHTGSLRYLVKYVLRKPTSVLVAQIRLVVPVSLVSGFINNTPLVAMLIPAVESWCRTTGISPSKLMIPLSYASILGGTMTIIGTSTNLIVVGLAQRIDPTLTFPFFEIAYFGGPILIVGWLYIFLVSRFLLPEHKSAQNDFIKNPRQYTMTLVVESGSPLAGKTIEDGGLRNLKGMYLVEVEREGETLPAVGPESHLYPGDVLLFAGDVSKVKDLFGIRGLKATHQEEQAVIPHTNRILVEVSISPRSSLVGKTLKESHFRERFDAAVISVYREGEPVKGKLGEITLQGADTMLLVSKKSFVDKNTNSRDFLFVMPVDDQPIRHDMVRLVIAPLFAIVMIILFSSELVSLITAALFATFSMYFTGCITWEQIQTAVNMPVIVTIAASFAMASALEVTGVAATLADNLLSLTQPLGAFGILYGVYLGTTLLTALLSNASAAAIMVPIAFSLRGVVAIKAALYVIMVGASADFSTPIGYQTNLMVWGPGGYKFTDYTKVGLPLQLLLSVVTVSVAFFLFAGGSEGSAPPA